MNDLENKVSLLTFGQIILVMLLWAVCFPLIVVGIEYAPHLTFAAFRSILAGAALTALAVMLRRPVPKDVQTWWLLALVGFGATTLAFVGMFHAAEFISPGIATVIANTQPLLAAVLAGVILNERIKAVGWAGLALGFAGIIVISVPRFLADDQGTYIIGVAYIGLAAVGVSVSNVAIKRLMRRVDALMVMGLQMLIGSVPLLVGALWTEDMMAIDWSYPFIASLLSLSLLGTSFAYWLWCVVLSTVPLNRANAFSFLVPIFGLTMGMMFYGESLDWRHLLGIVLTLLGVGLVVWRR